MGKSTHEVSERATYQHGQHKGKYNTLQSGKKIGPELARLDQLIDLDQYGGG